ncbi:MAG: hypothetical protein ABI620_05995 [Chloroflexota bacterium]
METLLIRRRRPIGEPRNAAPTKWEFASTLHGPAGAGRICLALAELGVELDALQQAVIDPTVGASELDAFDLGDRFDTVVLASHLLNLPDERARLAFVRAAARHATPHARLLLEHHPIDWAETAEEAQPTPGSVVGMTEVRRHVPFVSAVSTYDVGGRYERVPFTARVLSEAELDHVLASVHLSRHARLTPTFLEARLREPASGPGAASAHRVD